MNNVNYTYTIKPSKNEFKGNQELLLQNFRTYLALVNGTVIRKVFEDVGTNNVHIHAIINCPVIKNKLWAASKFYGYHIKADYIRFKEEDQVNAIWNLYIHKSLSDSQKYYLTYGNMFDGGNQL